MEAWTPFVDLVKAHSYSTNNFYSTQNAIEIIVKILAVLHINKEKMIIAKKMNMENSLICKNCFKVHLEYLFTYNFEWNKIIHVWYGEDSSDHGQHVKVIGEDRNQQHTSVIRKSYDGWACFTKTLQRQWQNAGEGGFLELLSCSIKKEKIY